MNDDKREATRGFLAGAGVLFIIWAALALTGCLALRDSPYSDSLERPERDLNTSNLQKIGSIEEDGVVRIAVFTDAHQNYGDLDRVIGEVNATAGVDFSVNLGDITNSSYNAEYDRYLESATHLDRPFLTLIGNHDSIGAGPALFRKAFGPSNYTFESEHVRFVFWNSISWENEADFDPDWLIDTVAASTKPAVIFTHIPLDDQERFDDALRARFAEMAASNRVIAVLNGHNHVYQYVNTAGTVFLQAPRVEETKWLLFEVRTDGMHIKDNQKGEVQWAAFKSLH